MLMQHCSVRQCHCTRYGDPPSEVAVQCTVSLPLLDTNMLMSSE